ncbi:aminopeptidase N [Thalassomonas sp. M1454]|uniref:aminopeptidase N n=1 Tax=Thalassomonas sp. M1454 TaxID=2594477 RepID=UPI00117C9995|nr:aminopeptidase N [Thalassomonas sp. M1454]TRX56665.1 aminopeptidase N [Thalassomonas sp. M1454]
MTDFTPRYLKDYQTPDYTITTVDLTFDLDETATLVTNVMKITRQGKHNKPLKLDGEHLKLISIAIDGKELSKEQYQVNEQSLVIDNVYADFELTLVTEISPSTNTALEGLYKSGDAYCTQCEAEGFRRISYFLDRPDVMAVYTTTVIADKQQFPYLLANGNNIAQAELEHGKHSVTWHDPFPKPCYLFALVAGDFDVLADHYITKSGRKVGLEFFVDKGNLYKTTHAMESLKKSMAWDEEQFNLEYDLDIYMVVAVDFFNMGAMENKGLNVFNSKFVLADDLDATDDDFFNVEAVIAHEYFHNWTGNRVTCRDWFQLSLKEGLTVFRDQQFSADMTSQAVTRIKNVRLLRSQQFSEDAGPMAHPIRPEKVIEMNNFYTMTVYEKGAEVIRMLHTLLGEQGFKAGIALYFERFDGQAVTCDDFVQALSDATATDLSQFKLWYSQSGTPQLIVTDSFDASNGEYHLTIKQTHPETHDKQVKQNLHIPVNIELIDKDTAQSCQQSLLQLTQAEQTWTFKGLNQKPVPALLGNFSAPVKLSYDYNEQELLSLMMGAKDEFIRWDAGQTLFALTIKALVSDLNTDISPHILTAIKSVLTSDSDNAFKAEQLSLPSFDQMSDAIFEVEPGVLVAAISKLKVFIAQNLHAQLSTSYDACVNASFAKDGKAIGDRALKNVCLDYLASVSEGDKVEQVNSANERVLTQYNLANNMTDQIAALKSAAVNDLACFEDIMQRFEQQWQDNTLVMDKWFAVNALHNNSAVIDRVTALLNHDKFSLENPNRARALIASFAFHNAKYFHQKDGRGYQFLAEQIGKLNSINPQVASRILTPLIQFKAFSSEHQAMMLTQLNKLNSLDNLARDLQEKLTAALS